MRHFRKTTNQRKHELHAKADEGCMRTSCEPWRATSLSGDAVPDRLPNCPPAAPRNPLQTETMRSVQAYKSKT